jgi:tRNA threonylcarbamoyladenosine biosynthesis protein TsaB
MSAALEPILLLDASRPAMCAGVLSDGRWLSLESAEGDAIRLLPTLVRTAMEKAGLSGPKDIRTFAFCEGPGALLSLRLAAMLVNSWLALPENEGKKVLGARSVEVAAALLAIEKPGQVFRMATSVRRGTYFFCDETCGNGGVASLGELAASPVPVRILAQRRAGKDAEPGTPFDCDLSRLPEILAAKPELFRKKDRAEVFAPILSEYKLWQGERHRAPETQ